MQKVLEQTGYNVATESENGHFVETTNKSKVTPVEELTEGYLIEANVGEDITMKTKNHGEVSLKAKQDHSYVVFRQDNVSEITKTITPRND